MTVQSFTGEINTDGEFVTVASLTDISFVGGNTYSMQIQNGAYLKVGDAIFFIGDEKFTYTAGTEDLYIKTTFRACTLTILENEEAA